MMTLFPDPRWNVLINDMAPGRFPPYMTGSKNKKGRVRWLIYFGPYKIEGDTEAEAVRKFHAVLAHYVIKTPKTLLVGGM